MKLNINTDAAVVFTNKLEKLHRSGLPVAVRTALNSAAFDVKQNTMPRSADKAFVNRSKNFFKANSKVNMANGFNMNNMEAKVGFISEKLKGGDNFAVKDLEQQERGGTIDGRSFIPMDTARTGKSNIRNVRRSLRISGIKKSIIDSKNAKGKNRQERFVKSAIHAGKGGFVIGNFEERILWKINGLGRNKKGTFVKKSPVYSVEKNREVSVKSTHFMRKASLKSADKLEKFYVESAKKQIARLTK